MLASGINLPHASTREAIGLAIHLVVHIARDAGRRRVTELVAIRGYNHASDRFETESLVVEGATS